MPHASNKRTEEDGTIKQSSSLYTKIKF